MSDAVLVSVVITIGTIITAGISGFSLIQATRTQKQAIETHNLINSRMDQLLEVARIAARAEGVVEGVAEERERVNAVP